MSLPWQAIATAPRTGIGILAYGLHEKDAPARASPQVKAGDHWWAIILWDVWRESHGWVFAKDGQPTWSEPTHWCELDPPDATPALIFPRELTPELTEVLGQMLWRTTPIAHAFRDGAGAEIRRRVEDEQAYVLHWLTALALEHGRGWGPAAADRLAELSRSIAARRAAATESAP